MGLQQSAQPATQQQVETEPDHDNVDNTMTKDTKESVKDRSKTATSLKIMDGGEGHDHTKEDGKLDDHNHDHNHADHDRNDSSHGHGHGHSHDEGDGCCGDSHGCMCAFATKKIIKSFLPLLDEERQAELDRWTLNYETWACVPNADAPSFAIMEALYSYKFSMPANEAPTVNAFMKVVDKLNHHVKVFGSAFFAAISHETDTAKHLDDKTMRCVFPTHRYGAWIGVMVDVPQAHAVVFNPSATLSETDKEELVTKLAPFKTTKLSVMTPKTPVHMRYSALVVCTGLEVLARAGWAEVATRVFGKLAEIIAGGGDFDAILDGITEESMHADEIDDADDKADDKEKGLSAKLAKLAIDPASNAIAALFADRIAWSLASGELNAPKWECKCASADEQEATDDSVHGESDDEDDAGSDKENIPPPAKVDDVDESPAHKKRKEEKHDE